MRRLLSLLIFKTAFKKWKEINSFLNALLRIQVCFLLKYRATFSILFFVLSSRVSAKQMTKQNQILRRTLLTNIFNEYSLLFNIIYLQKREIYNDI